MTSSVNIDCAKAELIEIGRDFHHRGWSLGTSSNYSVVLSSKPLQLLMTASGFDKGRLTPDQFVTVNEQLQPIGKTVLKPSAEAGLHLVLARTADAGAVLHTHSIWGTLLSERYLQQGYLQIGGYEMLKALAGITTHETMVRLSIFPNTQNIKQLATEVEAQLRDSKKPLRHGFLIAGHGLYTWGKDLSEARRHVEALEFLMEIIGLKHGLFAKV